HHVLAGARETPDQLRRPASAKITEVSLGNGNQRLQFARWNAEPHAVVSSEGRYFAVGVQSEAERGPIDAYLDAAGRRASHAIRIHILQLSLHHRAGG